MSESVTLEKVIKLAKQLSPLDRIRLIEEISPRLKRDTLISPTQPHSTLQDIWQIIKVEEEKAQNNTIFDLEK